MQQVHRVLEMRRDTVKAHVDSKRRNVNLDVHT